MKSFLLQISCLELSEAGVPRLSSVEKGTEYSSKLLHNMADHACATGKQAAALQLWQNYSHFHLWQHACGGRGVGKLYALC